MTRLPSKFASIVVFLSLLIMIAGTGKSAAANWTWDAITGGAWTNGNWNTNTNWDTDTVPVNDGTADVRFDLSLANGALKTGVDQAAWSINSLYLNGQTTGAQSDLTIVAGPLGAGGATQANQTANLTLMGGGLTQITSQNANGNRFFLGDGGVSTNVLTVTFGAAQTWNNTRVSGDSNNSGRISVNANFAGSGNLIKTGNGQIRFESGNSTAYTGTVTLKGGELLLSSGQMGRLGTNTLLWQNDVNTVLGMGYSGTNQTQIYSQNINFSDTGTGSYAFGLPTGSPAAGSNNSITLSGTMNGTLNETLGFNVNTSAKNGFYYKITGNNTLTSSLTAGGFGGTASSIFLRTSHLVLDNANALGTGNNFSFAVGQSNGANPGDNAGLYATSGSNVSGKIFVNSNTRGTTALAGDAYLGLHGTGAVTFSGAVALGTAGDQTRRINTLRLTSGDAGTATFSGQFTDEASNALYKAPVIAEGGGKVILSHANNTYGGTLTAAGFGGTDVIGGTALLVNGGTLNSTSSGTGTGRVLVGFASGAVANVTTTTGSSLVTVAGGVTGLVIGQTISGTGIAAGSVIENLIAGTNTVELSKVATASGTVTVNLIAETGILGGTGRIAPGSANGITVAANSFVSPADSTLPSSVGTLILNGVNTSAALLTMQTDSKFTFELSGAASDQINFWNYASGDLTLNSNAVNLTLNGSLVLGDYTVDLFRFYSDAGSAFVASGISAGNLTLGSIGANIANASLKYDTLGAIQLTYSVIPEPSTSGLIWIGLGACVLIARLRRSRLA